MIKAIIFDFDGVIGDTYDISFQVATRLHPNITKQDFLNIFMGNVYVTAGVHFTEKDIPTFFEKTKQAFTSYNFFAVQPMLEKLSEKYKLFIISGTIDDNIKHFLALGNLGGYFQKILGATTHRSKIARFKMVFNEFNVTPEECLFVTDTVGDIVEAREANVESIAVTWGFHNEQLLLDYHPKAIAHTPDELIIVIEALSQ
jgi:phosphoglycolate phosphatase